MSLVLLSAALLSPLARAEAPPPPIVNGTLTSLYPQAVLLRHADAGWNTVYVCTGTLVAPRWVLTAAHCTVDAYGDGLTEMHAYVGDAWTFGVAEVVADDWFPHPDYFVSPNGLQIDHDLGFVHLAEPIDLAPITLATTVPEPGETLRWVGWGASGDHAGDSGYYKRYADMPVVGLEDEFLLAYDAGGAATCGGDSGGPVFRLDGGGVPTLVAAHSFGRDDDGTLCAGSTSGDTRVDLYLDWIAETIGEDTGEDTDPQDTGDPDVEDPEPRDTDTSEEDEASGCACDSAASPIRAVFVLLATVGAIVRRRR